MAVLYHYCSNEAFRSIISSHKIWASEFTLSNDVLEGKWIREVVHGYCKERELSPHTTGVILQGVDILISPFGAAGVCLSEHGDLLSQWRAYSANASGVSIGFDQSCFGVQGSELPTLKKIVYDPSVQKAQIQEYLDKVIELIEKGAGPRPPPTILGSMGENEDQKRARVDLNIELSDSFVALLPHLYVLKNPAFQEEREWRSVMIVAPPEAAGPEGKEDSTGWLLHRMDFRALPDRIVPYREISLDTQLDRSVITDVVLGPRNVTPPRIVEAALTRHGWKGVKVRKSTASYR